ncbi:MAG: MBL fold metallo-hydrolase [Clostridia bacterium]|nr:MBL fold metallo-hydrolase [Clostridia bacterium]
MSRSKRKFRLLVIVAVCLAAFAYRSFPTDSFDGLTVTFVDVGQGDSVFIKAPNGKTMLLDCGEEETFYSLLKPFLMSEGVRTLDALVASHYHSDHVGAADDIFETFGVKSLVVPDYEPKNKTKKGLLSAARKENAEVVSVSEGALLPEIDPNLKIAALHPAKGGFSDNENENSLVLKLEYFGTTILLTGDIEQAAEEKIARMYEIETDILKVAHHGSSTSSCAEFLQEADPTYAIIQCGEDNSYGHPHHETMSALEDEDVRIYRTDTDGNIVFRLSERGIESIKTSRF